MNKLIGLSNLALLIWFLTSTPFLKQWSQTSFLDAWTHATKTYKSQVFPKKDQKDQKQTTKPKPKKTFEVVEFEDTDQTPVSEDLEPDYYPEEWLETPHYYAKAIDFLSHLSDAYNQLGSQDEDGPSSVPGNHPKRGTQLRLPASGFHSHWKGKGL